MNEEEYKVCPLLEARGVSPKRPPRLVSAFDDSWLKICIGECPIDACIFFDCLTVEEMGEKRMKIKVPREIKIGAHRYSIAYDDKLEERSKKIGFADITNGLILIEPKQMDSAKGDVLIHEILHIVDFFFANKTLDEGTIQGLTTGLLSVLDNLGIEFDWSAIPAVEPRKS